MEDGGVDTTVIESRQHKMGQMADIPPLLASSVFDSLKKMHLKLNQTIRHRLMNLVNTNLFQKIVGPF